MSTTPLPHPEPRGLLLLDVDGPLNPWAAPRNQRPEGYTTYRLTRDGRWYTGSDIRRHKGLCVWLHPEHGAQLLALAAETGLSPVWATTWLSEANRLIGPSIGLPELPVIDFPEDDLQRTAGSASWRLEGRWKYPGVAQHAGDLPIAWLDDEHDHRIAATEVVPGAPRTRFLSTLGRAREEFLTARAHTQTLLCQVNPRTGLTAEHFDAIRRWAAVLPEPTAN